MLSYAKGSLVCSYTYNWQTWEWCVSSHWLDKLHHQIPVLSVGLSNYLKPCLDIGVEAYSTHTDHRIFLTNSTCWDLLKRWISSMNRMVFLLHSRSSFCACLITSLTSLVDALVADKVTKRVVPFFLLPLEIMWASVVWKTTWKTFFTQQGWFMLTITTTCRIWRAKSPVFDPFI